MPLMRDVHLRNLDLNLIHPLHALLEERHVTRAAKRNFLSQSVMSRALERLRDCSETHLHSDKGRTSRRTRNRILIVRMVRPIEVN
jgi:DNA-binding transcriptional LysR family regulator